MFEKRLKVVPEQAFIADGTPNGLITVVDAALFKAGQKVIVTAQLLPTLNLQVKLVVDATQLIVGEVNSTIPYDLSSYTTLSSSSVRANEQNRPSIPQEEFWRAVYEEGPTVALRSFLVDRHGDTYKTENPLAVKLSDGLNELDINPDGSLNVVTQSSGEVREVKSLFNNISSVGSSSETLILSYAVPVSKSAYILSVNTSGNNVAQFNVYINDVLNGVRRTSLTEYNTRFEYSAGPSIGLKLIAGDTIKVKVIHERLEVGDFESRLMLIEEG